MGRVTRVTYPDNTDVFTTYFPNNAVRRSWGSRTYPVEYGYDLQGRLTSMTTWQNFAGDVGRAVTSWRYDSARGSLAGKSHPDGRGPSFAYTPGGRLRLRTWARGVTTLYSYNHAGELETTDYSDSTPDVSVVYDRLGRATSSTDGTGTRDLSYQAATPLLVGEAHVAGDLTGLTLQRTFDPLLRLSSVTVGAVQSVGYTYDSASRLKTMSAGSTAATYEYLPGSRWVSSVTLRAGGADRVITSKSYDNLNRLTGINHAVPGNGGPASFSYTYNAANQRRRSTRENGAYWDFGFDALGQVTAAGKYRPAAQVWWVMSMRGPMTISAIV